MPDQFSLKEKFLNLHKSKEFFIDQNNNMDDIIGYDLLKEAVHNAILKAHYALDRNDISFLEQFPSILWAQAFSARFDMLFEQLKKLQSTRKSLYNRLLNKYFLYEKNRLNTDEHSSLTNVARSHLAKIHASSIAKTEVVQKFPAEDFGGDETRKIFNLTTGRNQNSSISAFPFINGSHGLMAKLEGSPNMKDGHDLFNPREFKTKSGMSKQTDGFNFPTLEQIQDMITNHLNHSANGLVDPITQEEIAAYNTPKNNWLPVNNTRNNYKDTHSLDVYVDDIANQLFLVDDSTLNTSVKRLNAKNEAKRRVAQLVNQGFLYYSNGNKMHGATIVEKNGKSTIKLQSDDEQTDNLPTNILKLPHKMVDGKNIPVLLPAMPFKFISDPVEHNTHEHLKIGRDFYDINDGENRQIFRKLDSSERKQHYQGTDVQYSGALDPNRMSPNIDFLPKNDKRYKELTNKILTDPNFNFNENVSEIIENWLDTRCSQDNKNLCIEKMILSRHKDILKTLAEVKVLKNLNKPNLFNIKEDLDKDVLKKLITDELDRLLQQDLSRGSRRKRDNNINRKRKEVNCTDESSLCTFNYDVLTIVEQMINDVLKIERNPTIPNSLKELRIQISSEIGGMFGIIDSIRLMYEASGESATAAETRADEFADTVLPLPTKGEFIDACKKEIATLVDVIRTGRKTIPQKLKLANLKDFLAIHDNNELLNHLNTLINSEKGKINTSPKKVNNAEVIPAVSMPIPSNNKIEKTANSAIDAIVKNIPSNISQIPTISLNNFLTAEDNYLSNASVAKLEILINFIETYIKLYDKSSSQRMAKLRQEGKVKKIKKEIRDRTS